MAEHSIFSHSLSPSPSSQSNSFHSSHSNHSSLSSISSSSQEKEEEEKKEEHKETIYDLIMTSLDIEKELNEIMYEFLEDNEKPFQLKFLNIPIHEIIHFHELIRVNKVCNQLWELYETMSMLSCDDVENNNNEKEKKKEENEKENLRKKAHTFENLTFDLERICLIFENFAQYYKCAPDEHLDTYLYYPVDYNHIFSFES